MKKKKKEHHEEHVDETWLLPYSDMLTLLLALFIVMFAMSKVDSNKFRQISREFNSIFSSGAGVLRDSGGNSGIVMPVDNPSSSSKTNIILEQNQMVEVKKKLEKEIKSSGNQGKIGVNLDSEGLSISIQDTVIFNSGEADILSKFDPVLAQISSMIKNLNNDIRISGHTDNVPIKSNSFRSNWDLSYMRASNVMNYLVEEGRINPEKFSIQAYGEYSPLYDNSTAEGKAKNRRVDILIVRKYH